MRILFHSNFIKKYAKLSRSVQFQTDQRIVLFEENSLKPTLHTHKLKEIWKNHRSINITGDLRAIYKLLTTDTIQCVEIDTHSNLYS